MNLHADSLWIGALIKERIDSIVPVYPCVATEDAPAEFCVYRRTGYDGRNTKDRFNYEETIDIVLTVASSTYIKSIEIAQRIKESLDGIYGVWRGKKIESVTMTNALEEYSGTKYVQMLYFSLTIDTSFGK